MSAPKVILVQQATMSFQPNGRGGLWAGVPAIFEVGGVKCYSQRPRGAGDAESINRQIRELVASSGKET